MAASPCSFSSHAFLTLRLCSTLSRASRSSSCFELEQETPAQPGIAQRQTIISQVVISTALLIVQYSIRTKAVVSTLRPHPVTGEQVVKLGCERMAKNGLIRLRATRWTVGSRSHIPWSRVRRWRSDRYVAARSWTLIDTGELVFLKDANVHLQGIQPSVVVVRISTNTRQDFFFATLSIVRFMCPSSLPAFSYPLLLAMSISQLGQSGVETRSCCPHSGLRVLVPLTTSLIPPPAEYRANAMYVRMAFNAHTQRAQEATNK